MNDLIDIFLLDFLLGENNLSIEEREIKLKHLKEGFYDDFQVTIEFPASVDDGKFDNIEDYLAHLKTICKAIFF